MSKRPPLSTDVTIDEERERPTYQPKITGRPERDKVQMTWFVGRGSHKRLKELATSENISLQQLVTQLVDESLAQRGEPPLEEISFSKKGGH